MIYIGVDTSCYTSSIACVDSSGIVIDLRTMLCVPEGDRGLRQSEAVFAHIKNLEQLTPQLKAAIGGRPIGAVAVSATPRPAPEAYMPVFLAGSAFAYALSAGANAPLYKTTHQQGHIRAALLGNEAIKNKDYLAVHISGGTTEVLKISGNEITLLGGTLDISAGQLVDRVGVALGLGFPAGKALEALALSWRGEAAKPPARLQGLNVSFSGAETNILRRVGEPSEKLAFEVFDFTARALCKLIAAAEAETGIKRTLLFGGVASSTLLRRLLGQKAPGRELFFARPELSCDNAVGVAYIAKDILQSADM